MTSGGPGEGFPGGRGADEPEGAAAASGRHDARSGTPAGGAGAGIPPEDRQWTHPSEVGLHHRVEVDRRRSRLLVVGLVAVCAGMLLGAAAVLPWWGRGDTGRAPRAAQVLGDSLAMVERLDDPDSEPVTGIVIDDGRHVLVPAAAVHGSTDLVARVGGGRTAATVAASDAGADLAVLRLAAPFGSAPATTEGAGHGEPLVMVHFGPDGSRHLHQLRTAARPAVDLRSGTPTSTAGGMRMLVLAGPTGSQGPLADHGGRLAGWVVDGGGDHAMAYPADELMAAVERMLEPG